MNKQAVGLHLGVFPWRWIASATPLWWPPPTPRPSLRAGHPHQSDEGAHRVLPPSLHRQQPTLTRGPPSCRLASKYSTRGLALHRPDPEEGARETLPCCLEESEIAGQYHLHPA